MSDISDPLPLWGLVTLSILSFIIFAIAVIRLGWRRDKAVNDK
jgi:hypothetical protein